MGDLNGWIGDRAGITGAFGVSGENGNSRRVVEFCDARGLCVGNTYFKHRSLQKYTRVARSQGGVEVKRMIYLVLVKREILSYSGMGHDLSDHHVVMCKVRLVEAWIKRREVVVGARRIRSEKMREDQ